MAYAPSAPSALSKPSSAHRRPVSAPDAPQGTFLPGTKVQVGSHRVVIEKYLSEGGFAHVYVVRVPREHNKHELAVLKRVAVPDREHLTNMRTEVETMKKVKGHKHVVAYIDSHASQLKGGGYEVFLLMEYCSGGGLIDFMNTRLQHRLTEPEILKIFADIAEGVACMHYLKPPLLHRDLKVENVLISKSSSSGAPTYKLCDFGSTAPPRPAAKTAEEGRLIEEDVQKHTTMQYRSPEMIDVWRKQPIDEKADIWALGVFLYKLCYYTTPFEDVGQMAILNASFKYPSHPSFSDRLKKLIGIMLKEDPKQRPNIYQVIKEVSSIRGTEVPIKDIYALRTHSEARRNESLPSPQPPMAIGLQKQAPQVQVESVPDIVPMRRGRPTAPAQEASTAAAKPSPSPARGDPFAALDSKSYDVRVGAVEDLSKRFPSLDEFSIAHENGEAFSFEQLPSQKSVDVPPSSSSSNLNERMTNVLADRAFGQSKPKVQPDTPQPQTANQLQQTRSLPKSSNALKSPKDASNLAPLTQPTAGVKPGVAYTSTGTGSSPPRVATELSTTSSRPIWKVPENHRSSSQPRASAPAQAAASSLQSSLSRTQRPAFLEIHRSKSQTATLNTASSRPSLEAMRPSQADIDDLSLSRAKSTQSRQRPSSMYLNSNLDYLRDQETTRKRSSMEGKRHSRQPSYDPNVAVDESNIDDDMDYLRSSEDTRPNRKASGHKKRTSLSGAKHMIVGRFGEAFKRFENHAGDDKAELEPRPTTPDMRDNEDDDEPRLLSPIEGSQPTPSKHSDIDSKIDETEDLPPDVRRELERRRLSQEEKRVADAAAEYKARLANDGSAASSVPSKASTIQKRVQSLLDEAGQSPTQTKRTAEGYGRYTDVPASDTQVLHDEPPVPTMMKPAPPPISRKPITSSDTLGNPYNKVRQQPLEAPARSLPITSASAPPMNTAAPPPRVVSKPSVPPKSQALRTGGGKAQWPPPSPQLVEQTFAPPKATGGLAALLAKDLEGVPDYPPSASNANANALPRPGNDGHEGKEAPENIEADFNSRYPRLSGIEMVETEI